jgi:lysophospholipase L1-like esterase
MKPGNRMIASSVVASIRCGMFLAALMGASSAAVAQTAFALREGDRVVFYGDSITDQRRYTSFVETYVVTRFPKMNVTFIHSGWGGDRVSGGGGGPIDVRLWRDVVPYNPTVVTIMLGMNDGGYRAFDQKIFDEYSSGFKHIVDTLKRQFPGIRITAIQPSPYDDVTKAAGFEGGYNKVLVRYGEFLREFAAGEKLSLADLNTPVVAALAKANAADPAAAGRLIPDRVHPGEQATLVMAEALLGSWNAPAVVTEVEIDAARKTAATQVNTRVSGLERDVQRGRGISWKQLDEALPMPLSFQDPLTALVLRSCDFMDALNRQPLRVKGLPAGRYGLRIDGEAVGSFSSEQLSSGISLAELATPMTRQAANVHSLTLQHNAIHATRWRQVQVPLQKIQSSELLEALRALDELEVRLVRDQRATAQPQMHRFELSPE